VLAKNKIINEKGNPHEQLKRLLISLTSSELIEMDEDNLWLIYTP
jgi:hypothetical protein